MMPPRLAPQYRRCCSPASRSSLLSPRSPPSSWPSCLLPLVASPSCPLLAPAACCSLLHMWRPALSALPRLGRLPVPLSCLGASVPNKPAPLLCRGLRPGPAALGQRAPWSPAAAAAARVCGVGA
eukprot:CAMPEP_0113687488 /NCGR_PEP_ID=MMETSP0038_2-20120614/15966_1 /TAXON_ID=2898 /ORGANISM="Cryptomonas paramecium" /LENGTH=124 /DNA_ID=CAMNT_0000608113 /DNA_START=138 /DNA_END=509 /DNA_ORIENTATION=- /assembly_acc=CAM_ASM_000170